MEYRKVCKVCGRIYCYNDDDVSSNKWNAVAGLLGSVASIANAVDGNRYDMYEQGKLADRATSKITDFSKCPYCGSRDIRDLTDEEYRDYQDGLIGDGGSKGSGGIQINTNASVDALIQRGMLFLEEGNWKTAQAYFDNALDADPTNTDAYIGKMMIDNRIKTLADLENYDKLIDDNANYIKALRFARDEKQQYLNNLTSRIQNNIVYNNNKAKYDQAIELLNKGTVDSVNDAYRIFVGLGDFVDSKEQLSKCDDVKYEIASKKIKADNSESIAEGIEILEKELSSYNKTPALLAEAKDKYERITKKEDAVKAEAEKKKKSNRTKISIASAAAAVLLAVYFLLLGPMMNYNGAVKSLNSGDYKQAYKQFKKASNYKDASLYLRDLIVVPSSISYKGIKGLDKGEYGTIVFDYSDEGYLIKYTDTFKGNFSNKESTFLYTLSSDSSGRITSRIKNGFETSFVYEDGTIRMNEDDLSYQQSYWTFDEKGNLLDFTFNDKSTNYTNYYKISKKNSNGLTESRTINQNTYSWNQKFAFSYDDLKMISKIVFSEQGSVLDGEMEYSIEYDIKYIPNAKVKSETLFTNAWILAISSDAR